MDFIRFGTIALFLISSVYAQQLQITQVFPYQHANNAAATTEIRIDFNLPIDTTNIAEKFVIFGNITGLYPFGINVHSSLRTVSLLPNSPFLIGEMIHVTVRSTLGGSQGESFSGFNWRFSIQPTFVTPPHFEAPVIYSQLGGWPFAPLFPADFNADGYVDILAPAINGVRVLTNDGQGNFSFHFYPYGNVTLSPKDPYLFRRSMLTTSTPVTDVDLDGQMEVFTGAGLFEFGADSIFHLLPGSEDGWDIKDMNRDGWPDMITAAYLPGGDIFMMLGIRYNDGSGQFGPMDSLLIDENIVDVVGGDFNNDGITDIAYATQVYVTGHNSLRVVYMDSNGDTLYRNIYDSDSQFPIGFPSQINPIDANNDAFLDIFIGSNAGDVIVLNDTQGGFDVGNAIGVGGGDAYHWTSFSDITADGWIDLLNCAHISFEYAGSCGYLVNTQSTFNTGGRMEERFGAVPFSIIGGDFNGDEAIDVATLWDDALHIYFNDDQVGISSHSYFPPEQFLLFQNYPNPFNGETTVRFYLSQNSYVESAIYDITGKEVKHFQKRLYPPGEGQLKWNGLTNHGKEVSSGMYIWRVKALGMEKYVKFILIR